MKRPVLRIGVFILLVGLVGPAYAQIGFGRAVAAGDAEVFVGEPGNQATPGFVYVYRRDGGVWTETRVLSADGAADADGFGSTVYIFGRRDDEWQPAGSVSRDADLFGAAVALQGDRLIVGAPGAADERGAAYLFELDGGDWRLAAEFVAVEGSLAERV